MPIYQKSLAAAPAVSITAANFPAAGIVFDFEGLNGVDTNLQCPVSGLLVDVDTKAVTRADGTADITTNLNVIMLLTEFPDIAGKHVFVFHIGKSDIGGSNGRYILGQNSGLVDALNSGLRLNSSGGACAISDGTTVVTAPNSLDGAGTAGALQAHSCIFEWGATMRASDFDGTTWVDRTPADISAVNAFEPAKLIHIDKGSNPAMVCWFFFDTLPSDAFLKSVKY